MIRKIFIILISLFVSINICYFPSFAEDTNQIDIFNNTSKVNNTNHYANKFSNGGGQLYIEDGDKELYYIGNNPSEEPIDGLEVSYDSSTSTYIINVTKDVTITSNNEDAISSREGDNLKIIGDYTLTINLNCDGYNHNYTYGIYSTNQLQIGEISTSDNLNIVVNDTCIINNNNEDSSITSYTYALCADSGIDIYKSNVTANISSYLAYSFNGDINIYHSNINHKIYALYTKPNFVYYDEDEDLTCNFYTLYSRNSNLNIINESNVEASFINFSEKSDILYMGLRSIDMNINDSKIDISAYSTISEGETLTYSNYFQAGVVSDNSCIIKESNIKTKYFKYGIAGQYNLNIENCDIDLANYSSGLYTFGVLSISYDDSAKYHFNVLAYNKGQIDFLYQTVLPAISVYKIIGEDVNFVPTSDNLIINLPSNVYITTDVDSQYSLSNNNAYRKLTLINPSVSSNLSISSNDGYLKYYDDEIIEGNSIDNLDISYEDGTYILEVLDDVEIYSYDEDAIVVNNADLKIIGSGNLTFNMENYDSSVENYCHAIIADGDLQIGELNSNDKLNIVINDDFSMDNDNKKILNSYSYGLKADDDIYIYNAKIIGNITCDLICSNYKNINIYNSELIHNIYANYKYPGIYRNESGVDFVSLYAEDDITINNNSSIKTAFVDYIPESCIYYNGIECDNFIINDSLLDLNNSYDLDTEQGKLNSNAISTGSFEASNSDIRINDFLFGVIGESLSFVNTNVNMRNYGSCIISILKVLIKFDSDKYNFNIVATNTGDISFEEGILPVITFFDGENLFVPDENILIFDLPDTLKVSTDLDDLFDITKNNTYRQINIVKTQTDNPDNPPYNPSHYVIPKTGIRN